MRNITDTPTRFGATPSAGQIGSRWDKTGMMTPQSTAESVASGITVTDERNRPMTDAELNQILPSNGYEIVKPPEGYKSTSQEKGASDEYQLPSTES
jgi:splicing factor 3B subunit 1